MESDSFQSSLSQQPIGSLKTTTTTTLFYPADTTETSPSRTEKETHSHPVIPHLFPDIIHHSAANARYFPSNAHYSLLLGSRLFSRLGSRLASRLTSRLSSRLASRLTSRLSSRLASHRTHPNLHQITAPHFLLASVLTPINKCSSSLSFSCPSSAHHSSSTTAASTPPTTRPPAPPRGRAVRRCATFSRRTSPISRRG